MFLEPVVCILAVKKHLAVRQVLGFFGGRCGIRTHGLWFRRLDQRLPATTRFNVSILNSLLLPCPHNIINPDNPYNIFKIWSQNGHTEHIARMHCKKVGQGEERIIMNLVPDACGLITRP